MKLSTSLALTLIVSFQPCDWLQAGCFSDCCPDHRLDAADATVLAEVVSSQVLPDGAENRFVTQVTLQVVEKLAGGEVPVQLVVAIPGGTLGGITHFDSGSVDLEEGERYFLHLSKGQEMWSLYQASALKLEGDLATQKSLFLGERKKKEPPVTQEKSDCEGLTIPASRQTPSGYFESSNVPGRLRRCDSGQPILIELDTQVLPSGISHAEALQAVDEALTAWSDASGLSFVVTENYDFGQSATLMNGDEETIHIQMHDLYNQISSNTTLGIGGGSISSAGGGIVDGVTFRKLLDRYVVMNHEAGSNQNPTTLAEVLTHEIGHALGLRHSSELVGESEPLLRDATMYFRAHNDGRGATTNCYDKDRIQYAYPDALPPVAFFRKMRVVSRPSSQPLSPVNSLRLSGFSSNGSPLTITFPNGLGANFSYDPVEQLLTYDPGGYFSDSISNSGFFNRVTYQVSDGTNTGENEVWVVAIRQDDNGLEPAILSNPLPEAWLEDSFGEAALRSDPTALRFQPEGDFDGDGLSNLIEFQMDSDAADSNSGPVSIQLAEDLTWLELQGAIEDSLLIFDQSNNLTNWNVLTGLEASAGTNRVFMTPPSGGKAFFRSRFGN